MKKTAVFLLFCIIPAACLAVLAVKPADFEKEGDSYYSQRNAITDTAADLANLDKAISSYTLALNADKTNTRILLKYGEALDFKYRYLTGTAEDKKAYYEALVKEIEPYGKTMSGTKEYNYLMALFWGQRGDYTPNVLEAAKEGVGEKIKQYAETLYGIDKTFEDYAASTILGRLHFKAPYIVFIMTWPDKNKSRAYLEEALKANPDDPQAKHFLADVYWDLGLKDDAVKLFKEASEAKPRKNELYYDMSAISKAKNRMKDLGIQ